MADQTNPFEMMGMLNMMQPNKYIDPAYQDKPLPLPGYYGTPTNAQGQPIQSFLDAQNAQPSQGTTLNSTPAQTQTPSSQWAFNNQMLNNQGANVTGPGQDLNNIVNMRARNNAMYGVQPQGGMVASSGAGVPGNASTPGAGGAAAPQGPDMRQAYLNALSNPGKVTTPGATVPQAQPLGQPSVLDSFLASHPSGGGAGAGNYNNSGFFNTLNRLRGS